MPEGPSIVLLLEELAAAKLAGKRVRAADGNAKIDMARMVGRKVERYASYGKHFLIDFGDFAVRSHFLMFGSYCINSRKARAPRLHLEFPDGELNLYSSATRLIEGALEDAYDFRVDVMSDAWDPKLARKKLAAMPDELACDALLDQDVFAGVGNIIKNEVLFRIRVHPESNVGALPPRKLGELVREARRYSFEFLDWKRDHVLRRHWCAHRKKSCPRCGIAIVSRHLGHRDRRAHYCEGCQVRYG